jgi:hypothetical protein
VILAAGPITEDKEEDRGMTPLELLPGLAESMGAERLILLVDGSWKRHAVPGQSGMLIWKILQFRIPL